uniref:Uncharacterized protein n=1 Tax=Anopheles albimanus TaxID=7167 RepID=A0A182FDX3_ANOAL
MMAIATLAVLQGLVEPKNVTGATTRTTAKLTPSTLTTTTPAKPRQHSTPTKAAATSTKKAPASGTPTKPAGSDREARGKRTLELGNYNGNYNYYQTVPAHAAQRRVSHAYQDPGQYGSFQSNYIQPQFSFGPAQSGAVGGSLGSYQGFEPQLDGTNTIGSFQSLPPQIHTRYIEPPEPIIEIIIKESNDSLPLDTQSLFPKQKKKKEEVQVFYVKYHKDEKNGQLVLDDPLPAIKPIPDESEEEEDPSQEPIIVTPSPPLKTTTLRAIINPDSEKYHSNSGIRISFGVEDKHQSGHQLSETESESVAQPVFRKASPSPPAIVQQPPFVAQRPVQAPSAAYQQQQQQQQTFDTRGAFVGGLVQQAAPNLGPTRAPQEQKPSFGLSDSEHLSNLKHVLPAGGELVPSVSKYEKHITETINGPVESQQQRQQQQQQQRQPSFNRQQPFYNIQPSQELISHSIAPQIETIPSKLPSPQRYVSQQAPEIIPNSEPLRSQQQVDPRFNYAAQQAAGAQGFDSSSVSSTPPTTVGTSRTTYSPTFSTTPRTTVRQYPVTPPATTRQTVSTTRAPPVTTAARSAAEEAEANAKKQKALFDLPDEVPDDLREQLLSSGILDNADISVLDYDKLGETDLQSLPPEHLANFFNAGGGAQLAGSSNVLSVVSPNGDKLAEKFISKNYDVKDKRDERDRYEIANGGEELDQQQHHQQQQDDDEEKEEEEEEPTIVTMPERQNVDLKVVRFDSNNQKNVTDRYIKQDSTILPSVDVTREADTGAGTQTEQIFNRYLPLKINGAQFPIPDVVELRGRRIASVVVLAPVDQPATSGKSGESASGSEEGDDGAGFLIHADDGGDEERDGTDTEQQSSRFERDVLLDSKRIKFIAGEALKQLIKKPSRENFRRWLEREGKTEVDLQSVVLLVTRNDYNEQEIFMYDIATKGVTHLSGELSAAFVQVAEENAKTQNLDREMPIVDSGIVEQMETRSSTEAVDYVTADSLSSSEEQDEQAEASERKAVYVYPENYRGLEVNSGYSHIKK